MNVSEIAALAYFTPFSDFVTDSTFATTIKSLVRTKSSNLPGTTLANVPVPNADKSVQKKIK